MDPEYAKLVGATASQGKSAMPGPAEVGLKIWQHLKDPFYDRGSNDKGLGIQLAYSIARVMTGYLIAVAPTSLAYSGSMVAAGPLPMVARCHAPTNRPNSNSETSAARHDSPMVRLPAKRLCPQTRLIAKLLR